MKIVQQLVSDSVAMARTYGRGNQRRYITIHETGNTDKGADAARHARLQTNKNPRDASWHWQVDDAQAIQSFDHSLSCWHGGDGSRGMGNLQSIAIEICVNSDGDFKKAVENAAELVKHIMRSENILIQNVVQHNKWSGKDCPHNLRDGEKGVKWADFIRLVREDKPPIVQTPSKKEDEKLVFSSPTLKSETEASLASKAHRQITVDAAVKAGAHASWTDKLANSTLTDADLLGLAVKYTVAVNK